MSRFLILTPTGAAFSAAHRRIEIWHRSLVDAGHDVVEFEIYGHTQGTLAAQIADRAPDAVLAVSLATAVLADHLPDEQPLWVDVPGGIASSNSIAPGKDAFTDWWRLAPVLDRADLITCSSVEEQSLIVAWLGWRGRFDKNFAAGELVQIAQLPPGSEGRSEVPESLTNWWRAPRRADGSFDATARREIRLVEMVEKLSGELTQIHSSKMWSLWMGTIRARRLIWSPFRWLAAAIVLVTKSSLRAASWLYLLLGTARLVFTARARPTLKPLQLADQGISRTPPTRRPRVLIVMPYPIIPADHGGAVRVFNLIRRLARECDLHVLVFIQEADRSAHIEALEPWVEKLWFHYLRPGWQSIPTASAGDLRPPSVRLIYDERVEFLIRDIAEKYRIDVVQLEYAEMAQYRSAAGDIPVILVEHDVSFRSFQRRRRLRLPQRFPASKVFGATFRDWMSLLRYEVNACRDVSELHLMSAADAEYLSRFLPGSARRMRIVPNGVDASFYHPPEPAPRRRGVLLSGNFFTLPNLDAFEYFMHEIWPMVRRLRPDAELSVVGAKMPVRIFGWHGRDGTTVVGAVPEMLDSYHQHQVLVVPLRSGSGTRLKLLEAFASGIPAVSTTIGAEGIECVAGEHLLIADDRETFAHAVGRLLDDPELATRLAANAMKLAEQKYDWSVSARASLEGLRQLMPVVPAPRVEVRPLANTSPDAFGRSPEGDLLVSVIIPTYCGGPTLVRCVEALTRQECEHPFEVLAVDSGSPEEDLTFLRQAGVRIYGIDSRFFNHGLTRDIGAELAVGVVLVFISQDAVPADEHWLQNITAPLFDENPPAAVQGMMLDFPDDDSPVRPFFWNTCGPRFYFTREMHRWVSRYPGPSFSTVSAAIRRGAWEQQPFGWAPIMEDKKWQRVAIEAGMQIVEASDARVFHSHDYSVRSLLRRCQSEGFGWRLLGESYTIVDLLGDLWAPPVWRDLARGLRQRRFKMSLAEVLYPWLRPVAVWHGNRRLHKVKH